MSYRAVKITGPCGCKATELDFHCVLQMHNTDMASRSSVFTSELIVMTDNI